MPTGLNCCHLTVSTRATDCTVWRAGQISALHLHRCVLFDVSKPRYINQLPSIFCMALVVLTTFCLTTLYLCRLKDISHTYKLGSNTRMKCLLKELISTNLFNVVYLLAWTLKTGYPN